MIYKFETTKRCYTPFAVCSSKDDARTIAAVSIAAESLNCSSINSDYFVPLSDAAFSDEINGKCFSLTPVLDEKSIEITDHTVSFDVKQDCLYFIKGVTDEDTAITMAAVAAAADDIDPCIKAEKYPFGWTIEAPAYLPKSVLTEFVTGRVAPIRTTIGKYAYNKGE